MTGIAALNNPKAPRRKKAEASETIQISRKERILNAAEELFSLHGYYGVTIRDIAAHAQNELGLVTYHFPSKEALFLQVLGRRAESFCASLRACLDEARVASEGRPPTIEAIIEAFVMPSLVRLRSNDPGWRNYIRLLGQLMNMHEHEVFFRPLRDFYHPIIREFMRAIQQALPSAKTGSLYWSFYFFHLAVSHLVSEATIFGPGSSRHFDPSDLDEVRRRIIPFFAAGFYRLAPD